VLFRSTTDERIQPTLPGVEEQVPVAVPGHVVEPDPPSPYTREIPLDAHAPFCSGCGVLMVRAGSCHACPDCGTTSGCS